MGHSVAPGFGLEPTILGGRSFWNRQDHTILVDHLAYRPALPVPACQHLSANGDLLIDFRTSLYLPSSFYSFLLWLLL